MGHTAEMTPGNFQAGYTITIQHEPLEESLPRAESAQQAFSEHIPAAI